MGAAGEVLPDAARPRPARSSARSRWTTSPASSAIPAATSSKERLGIVLPQGDEELQDDEPFVPDWPARDALAKRVLPRLLAGESLAELRDFARAGDRVSGGASRRSRTGPGAAAARNASPLELAPALARTEARSRQRDPRIRRSTASRGASPAASATCARAASSATATTTRAPAITSTAGSSTCSSTRWRRPRSSPRTTWHSRDGHYVLPPRRRTRVRSSQRCSGSTATGCIARSTSSRNRAWTYVVEGGSLVPRPHGKWQSTSASTLGEDRDPAYRLALRGVDDPLDAEFVECATTVFEPLLDGHRRRQGAR